MSKFESAKYWEARYRRGRGSGAGSYNKSAREKATYINDIIQKYNVTSVNDYGHGDGNQLQYIEGFKTYTGYDVSETVREECKAIFTDRDRFEFIDDPSKFTKADLALSLDVLYHLVEDDVFKNYLDVLFSIGDIILIYSSDKILNNTQDHVRHRDITSYIAQNFEDFELRDTTHLMEEYDVSMYLYIKK